MYICMYVYMYMYIYIYEKEKKLQYTTFTPLVFSVNGGMTKECSTFHKYFGEKMVTILIFTMRKLCLLSNVTFHF